MRSTAIGLITALEGPNGLEDIRRNLATGIALCTGWPVRWGGNRCWSRDRDFEERGLKGCPEKGVDM